MNRTLPIVLAAMVVAVAVPVASHEDTSSNPKSPQQHDCEGVPDWTEVPGVGSITANVADVYVTVYTHPPPHSGGDGQDPAPFLGVLWLENNGFTGLQKADYVCTATDGTHGYQSHSDQVIL